MVKRTVAKKEQTPAKNKRAKERKIVSEVFVDEYFVPEDGEYYDVNDLIADLTKWQKEAESQGFTHLKLRCVEEETEWDTLECYYTLVADRLETDEELSQRLAAERQQRANKKRVRRKAVEVQKAQQKKQLIKIVKRLSAEDIYTALEEAGKKKP
jgi:hypothetical protein